MERRRTRRFSHRTQTDPARAFTAYQQLGRLIARARAVARKELERRYTETFMAALALVLAAIEDYRRELVPLIVPITLLRHHVRAHRVSYLTGQLYLEPHPKELMLRNHV